MTIFVICRRYSREKSRCESLLDTSTWIADVLEKCPSPAPHLTRWPRPLIILASTSIKLVRRNIFDTPTPEHPSFVFLLLLQFQLMFLIALAFMADSMEILILSIISPDLHCEWHISGFQQATLTTVVFLGV